jgi:hypothetical protein
MRRALWGSNFPATRQQLPAFVPESQFSAILPPLLVKMLFFQMFPAAEITVRPARIADPGSEAPADCAALIKSAS